MSNDLKITITPEQFNQIQDSANQSAIDKKLGLIFQVNSVMQSDVGELKECMKKQKVHCEETVKRIDKRINGIVAPTKLNKKKVAGVFGGGGLLTTIIIKGPEWFKAIGEWLKQ